MTTIIEKFERNSNIGAAVILFTPDDIGKKHNETDFKTRVRQNVVFEAGYFAGKLGRDKVILINGGVEEMPSDLHGVLYTPNDNSWEYRLLKELKAIGFKIDLNLL